MSHFIIRIELKDIAPNHAIYAELYSQLRNAHIHDMMPAVGDINQWHALPEATYYTGWYSSTDAHSIRTLVDNVIKSSIVAIKKAGHDDVTITSKVFVVQASDKGNPFSTDYPVVSRPAA